MKYAIMGWAASLCTTSLSVASANEQAILREGISSREQTAMSVAIIGAGAAGASSAYHLAKYAFAADLDLNITVLERNSYVGGRSTTVNAYDNPSLPVELGASIFVEINSILYGATKEFNLSTSGFGTVRANVPGPALGIWDGHKFVLTQSASSTWWDTAKILWKYGLAPIKTMRLVKATIGRFLTIYEDEHFPFDSITQVLQDVGLSGAIAATGDQFLEENGIGKPFGRDVIQASTRVNYAQNMPYIHGLEAMVCMATDGAMSIKGGNYQIFSNMLAASDATVHLGTSVTGLEKQWNGTYILTHPSHDMSSLSTESLFDAVILAAPYQFTNFTLATRHVPDEIPYVQLHVTLFTSPHLLSPAFFDLKPSANAPHVILTTLRPDEKAKEGAAGVGSPGFFSISMLSAVTNPATRGQEYLYKVFSPEPPNSTFLSELLGLPCQGHDDSDDQDDDPISDEDITWIYRKVWNSYPYEYPRVTFEEVVLDEGLWYTGGIESVISTMETSALMGNNVARLVVDALERQNGAVRVSEAVKVQVSELVQGSGLGHFPSL